MNQRQQFRRGPPPGRHGAAVGLTVLVALLFWSLDGWSLPISHAVFADTSLSLLCLILMLGALARLVPRLRPVVPWGRELGISMSVTAGLHVAILLDPEFFSALIPEISERNNTMWTAAWWVGLLALAFALVLAATSNDFSQRMLGRGWKFVQRQAYTLFVLTWLHTAAYVLLDAGHGALIAVWLFWGLTAAAVLAQLAGFVHTVRAPRGPSSYRVPPKADAKGSAAVRLGAARWVGVVALWGAVVMGSWLLANVASAEERQVALLCERYEELSGLPMAEIRDDLMEVAPDDVGPGAPLSEWLEMCQDE